MTAPARLLGLRLQGFKSFAERTVIEFGGGISAVVGPNGSGKSNLADALRWALGEQGRSLRTRRSEDVIFAGSDRRAAIGMADVTIILDNADGLLPVDYSVLELGRRLYRSGENEYLLNKQRVRLRDLVDLLDAAHLADNAFLFIGQGMVDQALALRPEERRPLFEEVAGVRRHERRRRKAEEQLTEAEANLARVQDIVAELRPQARRLAVQAEQQTSRSSAGEELVAALMVAAHARWHEASAQASQAHGRLARARAEADAAMTALKVAETAASGVAAALGIRAAAEADLRGTHDEARNALASLELRVARLEADLAAGGRDRSRLELERTAAEADRSSQRRALAEPVPPRDVEAEAILTEAERSLADALAELGGLRASRAAQGDEAAAIRRAEAAREAEIETARRRATDALQRAAAEAGLAEAANATLADAERALAEARRTLASAALAEREATADRERARASVERAEGERQAATERVSSTGARVAQLGGHLGALQARLAEDETRPIAKAARKLGGRRVDADLGIDTAFRAAVELALGDAARGYLVERSVVAELAAERGTLVVSDHRATPTARGVAPDRERSHGPVDRVVLERAVALGGGRLADALRRDPVGAATRLLDRVCWVPDVAALVEIQPHLAVGWLAVVRDGTAAAGATTIALGRGDGSLERQAQVERLAAELAEASAADSEARGAAEAARTAALDARRQFDTAREQEGRSAGARRTAEESERAAGRALEAVAREAGWHVAQAARLAAEAGRATTVATELEASRPGSASGAAAAGTRGAQGDVVPTPDAAALATWEARATELRVRRDRLAQEASERDGVRRQLEARRARADAAATMDDERIERAAAELTVLAERERTVRDELAVLSIELAAAAEREARARAGLDEQRAADAVDRDRLAMAEQAAGAERDRLRAADERARSAEVADLEARLGMEAVREGLLVELAGLGDLALRALGGHPGSANGGIGDDASIDIDAPAADVSAADDDSAADESAAAADASAADESAALERALAAIGARWAAETPPAGVPPPGRLAHLRRRYHELGAANPFAVEEYAEVRTRLEALEVQERDLRTAIADTRRLIEELATMIADQFRTTFRALETAFDTRFQQLFGGGYARLSLTDPADLAATGVEIVARPPGKKAQALAMLSGGERALTAVALLFAMLEVRPVPFCVLDEVDAALDEANVGRFADALRSLADRTQFIVITHNRGTIEAADALYGVTVGDDSVSRVISLHLDEATALADRVGAERPAERDPATAPPVDVLA